MFGSPDASHHCWQSLRNVVDRALIDHLLHRSHGTSISAAFAIDTRLILPLGKKDYRFLKIAIDNL